MKANSNAITLTQHRVFSAPLLREALQLLKQMGGAPFTASLTDTQPHRILPSSKTPVESPEDGGAARCRERRPAQVRGPAEVRAPQTDEAGCGAAPGQGLLTGAGRVCCGAGREPCPKTNK